MSSCRTAPLLPRVFVFLAALAALCAATAQTAPAPYSSTYTPAAAAPVLFRHATILNGNGVRLDDADLLIENGKIAAVGRALAAPANATIVDAAGRWLSPGIIDPHSHLGGNGSPHVWATGTSTK
ncbi:hypothetical protein KY495_04335 [Massilia sp. PAMC28688]|uniref:amidohydrolase family protein n=1 Tax=Massilia sp. PAMC28688 TaxID=2861283 RepID=UPI001C636574|nr:hypothetical protein [Massilia sp. PAMC28688]QYF94452.1 hypothetical protein KY495_04335 [Massilia sp. PAMC28688]